MLKRSAIIASAILIGSSARAQAPDELTAPLHLHLVCQGQRQVVEQQRSSARITRDFDATKSASGVSTTEYRATIQGKIDVVVDGPVVRIEPTSILRNNGSLIAQVPTDGWYTLENPVIDADQITGQWHISFIQKPMVRIDRHTGSIRTIGGQMDFRGACEKAAPLTEQKF